MRKSILVSKLVWSKEKRSKRDEFLDNKVPADFFRGRVGDFTIHEQTL